MNQTEPVCTFSIVTLESIPGEAHCEQWEGLGEAEFPLPGRWRSTPLLLPSHCTDALQDQRRRQLPSITGSQQQAAVPRTLGLGSLASCMLLAANRWQGTHTPLSNEAKWEIKEKRGRSRYSLFSSQAAELLTSLNSSVEQLVAATWKFNPSQFPTVALATMPDPTK